MGGFGKLYLELEALKPRFSICIPVWEQGGFGLQYLKDLINSIEAQTFYDWEIVISDHSKNDDIDEFVFSIYKQNRDGIHYVRNGSDYGNGVANLNQALSRASGEIIKVMFQDDLMYSPNCLKILNYSFTENVNWLVNGCNHTRDGVSFEREMKPSWNDDIILGVNSISSPSVLAFRNENIELFDEKLTMLMDVEYYYRLYKKFGLPKFLNDILISNRCHENQISSQYTGDLGVEIEYVKNKYNL